MPESRRNFLGSASTGLIAAAVACQKSEPKPSETKISEPPPGAPPAFGTAPEAGPPVSTATFAEAEKLVQVEMTPAEREMAAGSWRRTLASLYERRTGPGKFPLDPSVAPATRWDPVLPNLKAGPDRDRFVRTRTDPGALPANDADIAFAPLTQLSRWIES